MSSCFNKIMLRATPPEEPRSGLKRMWSWLWNDHLKSRSKLNEGIELKDINPRKINRIVDSERAMVQLKKFF